LEWVIGAGRAKISMNAEPPPGFVDTNILVYAFDRSNSAKKVAARRLLGELMAHDRLRVSTQVLQELFVTLTKKVDQPCTSEEALTVIEDLTAWPLIIVDYPAIRAAAGVVDQAKISFWDALVVVAAVRSGASVLYSEDLNHGQEILGVRIENPFESLKQQ
jgi:predicted nucleic acid-binding protein